MDRVAILGRLATEHEQLQSNTKSIMKQILAVLSSLLFFTVGCATAPQHPTDNGRPEVTTKTLSTTKTTFLGLRTAIYHAPDINKAKAWYATVLGIQPYFDQPFYVGFNVGGFELGLDPDASSTPSSAAGVIVYWGVEDAQAALDRLVKLGSTKRTDVQDVGGGIKVATVLDPFGNILGVIQNPHFFVQSK